MRRGNEAIVVKFGGSAATNESGANKEYLRWFFTTIGPDFLQLFSRAAFVIGGGPRVRALQATVESQREKDEIGLLALRQHAAQMGEVLEEFGFSVEPTIPDNPDKARSVFENQKRFAVALGGLQVGQSTDTVAVTAAELLKQEQYNARVVILSNVWRIFTADPKTNPESLPIQSSSIAQLIKEGVLAHDPNLFKAGMSVTIDPVAVSKLEHAGVQAPNLFFGHAEDRESVARFAKGQNPNNGTVLSPKNTRTTYYAR